MREYGTRTAPGRPVICLRGLARTLADIDIEWPLRLHDLRHSFASFLVNKGVSLYVVQGLLGHSLVRTTQRYAHLANDTLADAAEVMRGVISPPGEAEIFWMSRALARGRKPDKHCKAAGLHSFEFNTCFAESFFDSLPR